MTSTELVSHSGNVHREKLILHYQGCQSARGDNKKTWRSAVTLAVLAV
jgi:hypothetical protein